MEPLTRIRRTCTVKGRSSRRGGPGIPHSIRSGSLQPLGPTTASQAVPAEACVSCREETAVGSVFFSDRHVVDLADGRPAYLCSLCDSRIRATRRGKRLTDAEVRDTVQRIYIGGRE